MVLLKAQSKPETSLSFYTKSQSWLKYIELLIGKRKTWLDSSEQFFFWREHQEKYLLWRKGLTLRHLLHQPGECCLPCTWNQMNVIWPVCTAELSGKSTNAFFNLFCTPQFHLSIRKIDHISYLRFDVLIWKTKTFFVCNSLNWP